MAFGSRFHSIEFLSTCGDTVAVSSTKTTKFFERGFFQILLFDIVSICVFFSANSFSESCT